jgi:hypothetical protein
MNAAPASWLSRAVVAWLPVAVVATVLAGTSYAITQHVIRSSADDAPRALSTGAAYSLSRGAAPAAVASGGPVDLGIGLGPFLIVYGADGRVTASTARLEGVTPVVPVGVLAEARQHGSDRITWQPRDGVREAVVAIPWQSPDDHGVVVAGASLRPAEERATQVLLIVLAGWLAAMIGSAVMAAGAAWLRREEFSPATGRY